MENDFVPRKSRAEMNSTSPKPYEPGLHVLADFWSVNCRQSLAEIEQALRQAAAASSATVLDVRLHAFGENNGITGVALLAESHISIHTWPEQDFVALDIFMCGMCDPLKALDKLREFFCPESEVTSLHKRGVSSHS
jgi:S-adenosylmethionine decarboxylase